MGYAGPQLALGQRLAFTTPGGQQVDLGLVLAPREEGQPFSVWRPARRAVLVAGGELGDVSFQIHHVDIADVVILGFVRTLHNEGDPATVRRDLRVGDELEAVEVL